MAVPYVVSDRDAFSGVIAYWHNLQTAEQHQVVVGSEDNPKRLRGNKATAAEALATAQAEWHRVKRGHALLSITLAEARPDLTPETPVTVQGWKAEIDATAWIITQVNHHLSESAYTMGVEMEMEMGV